MATLWNSSGRRLRKVTVLPPYTYVPGQTPHPTSDPRGHSFDIVPPPVTDFDPQQPEQSERWRDAVTLFEAGYYWEAHEAWESLWHYDGRQGPVADCLKGLIKWAAAGVKAREGRLEGLKRHSRRAVELLSPFVDASPITGLDLSHIVACIENVSERIELPAPATTEVRAIAGWSLHPAR